MKYFLDTYAMVEIANGNPAYLKFKGAALFTSLVHLYELYYSTLRGHDEERARLLFYKFFDYIVFIKAEHIFKASKFKLFHKKDNISYGDALGYAIAETEGMKLLTGDIKFKGLKNVEFVK